MKRLILICLLLAGSAWAGYIVDTTTTSPMQNDKIPVGRLKGGTSYTVTVDGLAGYAVKSGKSATFQSISTNSVVIPQGVTEQGVELFEAAANGENKVTIKADASLTADIVLTVKNDGLYKGATKVVSW